MDKISRFVLWVCSRFDRDQIKEIIRQLQEILENPDNVGNVKPKDDFKKNIQTTGTST